MKEPSFRSLRRHMSHHGFLYSCSRHDTCLASIPWSRNWRCWMPCALIFWGGEKKVCYFSNPLWTRNIITAVNSSGKRRNEWTSLFYYYYFWHGEPHACLRGADRRSLPRWQCCYNLLYNKHIFQAFQPGLTSLWAGTSAKQRITSHRLTHTATSHVVRTGASQYQLIYCLLGFYGIP